MSEPRQKELFEQNANRPVRQVVYVPPETSAVDQFAEVVCRQLSKNSNAASEDQVVVNGLASFLNFVAEATAKNLNRQNNMSEEK